MLKQKDRVSNKGDDMKKILFLLALGVLTVVGFTAPTMAEANGTVTPLEFAGKTCVPKGQVGNTWSYANGPVPVETYADPDAVSGQQQLITLAHKMESVESTIATNKENDSGPDVQTLDGLTTQYNNLEAKYDNCY